MSIWKTRSSSSSTSCSLLFEKHLKSMLSSSSSSFNSHALPQTLPRRSFQTVASVPPLFSSSAAGRSLSFLPALLFRPQPHRRPRLLLASFHPAPRALSSASSGQELQWREDHPQRSPQEQRLLQPSGASFFDDDGDGGYQDHLLEVQQEKRSRFIPVKAYFLCTSIDLRGLQSQNAFNVIPLNSRAANYVVLRYYDVKGNPQGLETAFGNESNCHYMVVFHYGSVVLFNISDIEADGYLKIVEKHASGLLLEMRKDDYAVVEKPTLKTWMQGGLDYIMLKNLSIDGIRTIGSVLGQSIALDYYIRQVDGMVAEFTDINRGMEKTGTFTMKRRKLFQLVGKANSNLADVILKLGLFERLLAILRDARVEFYGSEFLRREI